MPSSPGHIPPRTPDRRSSASHILTAFLNLTSNSRPKATSHILALPPTLTPVQTGHITDGTRMDILTQASFSEDGSVSTASQAASDDAMVQPSLTVLGGPPEVGRLLIQLGKTRPTSERINAALKLRPLLDKYKISNPLAIWSAGEDLLSYSADDASRAGMTLLLGCANNADLTATERRVLFDSLKQTSQQDKHLDLRVQILLAITNKGTNVDSVEDDVLSFASTTLKACSEAVDHERRAKRSNGSSQEGTLDDIFKYIVSVIKFNAKVLEENDLERVVRTVNKICQVTTASRDVENSIDVVLALLTFTQLPAASFQDCLELLADVYRQVKHLEERSWDAAAKIFTSHLGHAAILTYLDIIKDGGGSLKRMVCRGAFRLLAHLLEANGAFGLPRLPLAILLQAVEQGLCLNDRFLAEDVLGHAKELLFRDELRTILEYEVEWDSFLRCVRKSADILDLNTFSGLSMTNDTESVNSGSISRSDSSVRTLIKKNAKQKETVSFSAARCNLHEIILKLSANLTELDLLHKDAVVGFLLGLGPRLSNAAAEVVVTCCAEDRLTLPSSVNWTETCKTLVQSFLHDCDRPNRLRSLTISVLKQAWNTVELVSEEAASKLALLVLQNMDSETDGTVLDALASFAVMVVERADFGLFEAVLTIFRVTVFQRRPSVPITANLSPIGGFPVGLPAQSQPSLCRIATKHVVRMFVSNMNKSAWKVEALYSFVLKVAASPECAVDARICAVKLLFRLRATSNHSIYIRPLSESERIAAVLCRTAETASWIYHTEGLTTNDHRDVLGGASHQALTNTRTFDVRRPVPPLWFYPGLKGLPEEPAAESSIFVYSFAGSTSGPTRDEAVVLKIAYWLEIIINLLQQQDTDWEIYSYLVVHLGAQLSNQNLVRGCIPQVQLLRNVLCDQIRAASFHEPPNYTSLKKADVAVCLFHVLTMLVGYHDHFARSEEDEIVRTFILGVGSWDRTSKWCIHALSVCCHELPLSVSKMLDSIIQKMSQIITQSQVAVHILEFLVMLARLPNLYKNFREDEYKMVFGVSFRYLQYVRDKQERDSSRDVLSPPARPNKWQMRHSDSFRELRMLNDTDNRSKGRPNNEDLPQYVYALAFHVITFWFMNLRLDDRPMYMPWISKNLTYQSIDGKGIVEDQGLVTMDMMEKVAYTDRDETAYDPHFAKETDGEVAKRTWIIGYSLLTIETAGRTGVSQMTKRRPSGTKYSTFKPALTSPPRHQAPLTTGLAADTFYTSSYTGVLPEDIIQEFYSSSYLLDTKMPRPVPLPDDEAVQRAISTFDRNSTVDGHKVGVIYVSEGQECEAQILANTHGSADYTTFVDGLGFLTRLKDAQFNTQGLDRSEDTDGKYTYCWRDRATEIVFHVTTMMPTPEHDAQCVQKKSHIGNDFVSIVWNDAGTDFKFDTFPSDFNYVYIIITPESTQSFTTTRDTEHPPDRFYKVQVLSAPGFPDISPAAETKLLSAKALPHFVRLLALNASVFSLVWHHREGGEHVSPWRNRLREIKRLRDKYINHDGRPAYAASSPASAAKIVPPTTTEKSHSESLSGGALFPPPTSRERGGSALSHRLSLATFSGSEDLSRSSLTTSSAGDAGGHDSDR
jgi:hypothetical protein